MTLNATAANDRPNILVIHADQHRADCLGLAGHPDLRTPNLDALGADGVHYPNSYCCYPICTPSRYSLLSGLHVRQHLGWSNVSTLPAGLPTFPRLLRAAGYRTAAVGKMHFTPTYLDVGFTEMELAEQCGDGRYDDDYHRYLREQGLLDGIDLMDQEPADIRPDAPAAYWESCGAMVSDLPEEHHSTTWIADRAVERIERWEGGGNLLMVGFIKPHHPFDPPAPWADMYGPDRLHLPPDYRERIPRLLRDYGYHYFDYDAITEPRLRRIMAMYYATISQIDHHVGRLVDRLRRQGLYDNTLILYTSDHGDFMGHHGIFLKGNYMHEALVKVPLIVKYPGSAAAGTVSAGLVSNVDVAPMLVAAGGAEVPEHWPGNDFRRHPEGRDTVVAEAGSGTEYMIRRGRGKLIRCRPGTRGVDQFYDLNRDPREFENRIDDRAYAGEIARLREALALWALDHAVSPCHVDPAAPVVDAPNVPARDPVRVADQRHWFYDQWHRRYGPAAG